MDNISFQSRIKITDITSFNKEVRFPKKNYVNYPWTKKESVLADNAATTGVFDCTAAGLTDGIRVFLLHLCPTFEENKNFKNIENFIRKKIDLSDSNLQGFILGSKNQNLDSPDSPLVFDFFEKFMQKFNIPYSSFRGGNFIHNIAYSSSKDEWVIGSSLLEHVDKKTVFTSPEKACEKIFDKYKIAECDELYW